MVIITNKGFRGNGIYVGRPSPFGNPFPVKKSKFSQRVYSLKESLNLYREYFKKNLVNSREFLQLVNIYRENHIIVLDCWCINKQVTSVEQINFNKIICHAEIIAYFLLKAIK